MIFPLIIVIFSILYTQKDQCCSFVGKPYQRSSNVHIITSPHLFELHTIRLIIFACSDFTLVLLYTPGAVKWRRKPSFTLTILTKYSRSHLIKSDVNLFVRKKRDTFASHWAFVPPQRHGCSLQKHFKSHCFLWV